MAFNAGEAVQRRADLQKMNAEIREKVSVFENQLKSDPAYTRLSATVSAEEPKLVQVIKECQSVVSGKWKVTMTTERVSRVPRYKLILELIVGNLPDEEDTRRCLAWIDELKSDNNFVSTSRTPSTILIKEIEEQK